MLVGMDATGSSSARDKRKTKRGRDCLLTLAAYHAVLAVKDECEDALAALPAVFDP